MNLRPATTEDTEQAVEVWKAASAARRGRPSAAPGGEARLRSYIAKPDSFLIVAEDSGGILGMALGMQEIDVEGDGCAIPGFCHISAVFVSPGKWGQSIGKKLVDGILSEARSRNYRRAQLWTNFDNVRAQRLYEGKGFVRSGGTRIDDGGETIIHYEREL